MRIVRTLSTLTSKQRLHGALDLVLARARVDRERDDVARLAGRSVLFSGDERPADHVVDVHATPCAGGLAPFFRQARVDRLDRGHA